MNPIVLFDSPEAAQRVVINCWMSRRGGIFGGEDGERAARFDGCTHVACRDCGTPTERGWLVCKGCRDKTDEAKFAAMPEREWDGVAMVYSNVEDRFYESPDDIDGNPAELRLLLCKPQYAAISLDHFSDILPEDDEPDELSTAVDAFNKAMAGVVISWVPMDVRLKLPVGGSK